MQIVLYDLKLSACHVRIKGAAHVSTFKHAPYVIANSFTFHGCLTFSLSVLIGGTIEAAFPLFSCV